MRAKKRKYKVLSEADHLNYHADRALKPQEKEALIKVMERFSTLQPLKEQFEKMRKRLLELVEAIENEYQNDEYRDPKFRDIITDVLDSAYAEALNFLRSPMSRIPRPLPTTPPKPPPL